MNFNLKSEPNNQYPEVEYSLSFPKFSMTDIMREINRLDNKKSVGNSVIPTNVIKKCPVFVKILYIFFMDIVYKREIPKKLKISEITPVLKSGKPKEKITSYRPVTVTNIILKLFEILMLNNLITFITSHKILNPSQYGFRKKSSTETYLRDFLYFVSNSFNDINVKYVDIIFLDMSNAFDSIPHGMLLNKLKLIGIKGCFLHLIKSFLDYRKQYVKYNTIKSELCDITSGTPQGGYYPRLFSIYLLMICLMFVNLLKLCSMQMTRH